MSEIMQVTGLGFFAGMLGVLGGGLVSPRTGRRRFYNFINRQKDGDRRRGILQEFSSGLVTAVICFELLPEAFLLGGMIHTLLGILLGLILMTICQNLYGSMRRKDGGQKGCFWMEASLFCVPAGLALGAAYLADWKLAAALAAVIVLHNIPDGMRYLGRGGLERGQKIGVVSAYSLLTAFGSFSGSLLASFSADGAVLLMSVAGGILLYHCAGELLREDGAPRGRAPAILNILGILLGLLIAVCT